MAVSSTSGGWAAEGMCPKVQRGIDNIFLEANPENKDWITGTLDYFQFLRTTGNPIQTEVDRGDGSRNEGTGISPVVQLKWYQRKDPDSFNDGVPTSCQTGPETTPCVTDFEITNAINDTWTVNDYQVRRLCEGVDDYVTRELMSHMLAGAKRLNNEIADAMVANNIGVFEDGSASKSYRLINNTAGSIWGLGISDMKNDLSNSRYSGPVNVLGNGNWWTFFDLTRTESAGLADTGIYIPNRSQNMRLWNDPYLASLLTNTNHGLVVENNSIHLTSYNGWVGEYARVEPLNGSTMMVASERGTITDPRTGLTWDLMIERRKCVDGQTAYQEYYDFTLIYNWDLFQIPSDGYSATDELNGVLGVYDVEGTDAP